VNQIINETFLSALPWWAWLCCGVVSLFLGRRAGEIADDTGSTVAELANWTFRLAGFICIVIGVIMVGATFTSGHD